MSFNPFTSPSTQKLINGRIKELGIDTKKLCDKAGVTHWLFTKYQENPNTNIGIDKMVSLSSVLGIQFNIHVSISKMKNDILRSIQKENAIKEHYGFTSARKEIEVVINNTKP